MDEAEKNQKIIEIKILESQVSQLEQQIALIDRQIIEMQMLQDNLDDIKKLKNDRAFVPVGRDVFIESSINQADYALVNVGEGIFLKKNIEDAKKTIERQKEKFLAARKEIVSEMNRIFMKIEEIGGSLH